MASHFFIFSVFMFGLLFIFWKDFRKIFYRQYINELDPINEKEFYEQFERNFPNEGIEKSKRWKELIDKAWQTRDFEIDLYWKRANYFWLFQVPAFTAYFLIGKSTQPLNQPDEIFVIVSLGIIFSTAWFLINKGSKLWQRHWEEYIDLLERKYYGPFYQTVSIEKTFSVSKINEIVSFSLIIVWLIFAIKFLSDKEYLNDICLDLNRLNAIIAFSIFFTILGLMSMSFGYGRGYFKNRGIRIYRRRHHFINPK